MMGKHGASKAHHLELEAEIESIREFHLICVGLMDLCLRCEAISLSFLCVLSFDIWAGD